MTLQEASLCGFINNKVVESCCAQIIWSKQQLSDFGIILNNVPLLCDNTTVINLTKNLIMHSCTKHIEIKHYFLCEHIVNGNCKIKVIVT